MDVVTDSAPAAWLPDVLRRMDWKRLELVAAAYYESRGYRAETISRGPDGGVDVRIYEKGEAPVYALVQCKAWGKRVDVKPVRELLGVMAHEKVPRGVFIGTGGFTTDALDFAKTNHIECITGERLLLLFNALGDEVERRLLTVATSGDWTTPTCPSCGAKTQASSRLDGRAVWKCASRMTGCRRIEYPRRAAEQDLALEPIEEEGGDSTNSWRSTLKDGFALHLGGVILVIGLLWTGIRLVSTAVSTPRPRPADFGAAPARPSPRTTSGVPSVAPPSAPAQQPVVDAAEQARRSAEAAASEARRKELAWKDYFHRSSQCAVEANQTSVPCVNEYIRTRREFDDKWATGRL